MSEDNSIRYNLFHYAYKELSQDAVICWLIEWAYHDEPEHKKLTECGQKFIEALFAKHNKQVPEEASKQKIWQQNNSIDVLARVGDYILLIEDKTGTKDHNNQLKKYYEKVRKGETSASEVSVEEEFIIPIYLKTGNQSLLDHMRIEHLTPYKVFDRGDFLEVLRPYRSAHPTLNDFTNYLEWKDHKTQSYCKEGREEGNWWVWEGFLRELENHLAVVNRDNHLVGFDNNSGNLVKNSWTDDWAEYHPWGWNYVPNQSGGFAGFWWYFKTVESYGHEIVLYLQLEIKPAQPSHSKLCFKVEMKEVERDLYRNIREDCHRRILESGKVGSSGNLVCRPDRMGTGYTMTVAQWDNKETPWLVFKDEVVNIQETVKNLMEAQSVLDKAEGISG